MRFFDSLRLSEPYVHFVIDNVAAQVAPGGVHAQDEVMVPPYKRIAFSSRSHGRIRESVAEHVTVCRIDGNATTLVPLIPTPRGPVISPVALILYLDATGRTERCGNTNAWDYPSAFEALARGFGASVGDGTSHDDALWAAINLTFPAVLALQLLHCKNVPVEDHTPPDKLAKKHLRKHGRALTTYKTLRIDLAAPPRAQNSQNDASSPQPVALHACRGHFAEYGLNGKGRLFGKLTGRYWIPPHARGKAEAGIVHKSYEVTL